jgi:type II secretion system protein I
MRHSDPAHRRGFTLIEVMIAIGIFFVAAFAILGVVANGIANARRLQRPPVDAGVLAAQLSVTNKLYEGKTSGNLGDLLGPDFAEYNWTRDVQEFQSNKLFQIDFKITTRRSQDVVSKVSFLMFSPYSEAGSLDGGMQH